MDWRAIGFLAAAGLVLAVVFWACCKKTCCDQKWGPLEYAGHVRRVHREGL